MAGYVPKWSRESQSKGSTQQPKFGVVSRPIFHSEKAPLQHGMSFNFADGTTEEQYKAMGLEASNRDLEADRAANPGIGSSFSRTIDRLKAGNIDAPGSDAYERYGAGRGRMEENKKLPQDTSQQNTPGTYFGQSKAATEKMEPAPVTVSAVPSVNYEMRKIDIDKKTAMSGKDDGLPKPDGTMRPMGDPEPAKKTKPVKKDKSSSASPVRATTVKKPDPAKGSTTRAPVISDKTPVVPPADNATRTSKPYPAKAAAMKSSADMPSRQVPGAASSAEVDRVAKEFADLDKAYNAYDPKDGLGKESLRLLRDAAKKRYENIGKRK
tara:strand:+ start:4626 stop:5597 length:972 start_codon:yes stop_codon:yes gene_type:complete